MEVITTKNLYFSYGKTLILEDVTVSINERDFVSIVGPNGGGKTTLLKLWLGLYKPDTGTIRILDKFPVEASPHVGYMPQHARFDPNFPATVLDVVLMGLLKSKWPLGLYSKSDKEKALKSLEEVDLLEKHAEQFSELSGGQRQRALIARALVSNPKILFLDEPTSNLDSTVENKVFELLKKLNQQRTIIVVSHDIGFVSNYVNRVICINKHAAEHPTNEICGNIIGELYGEKMNLVRHDMNKCKGDRNSCKGL